MRSVFILMTVLVCASAECSDSDRLEPLTYHGATSVTSQKKAEVELVTGEVKRHRVDEDVLPHFITKGSWASRHPDLTGTFGADDQQVFVESLTSELVRLDLFRQATTTGEGHASDGVHIKLWFAKTDYFRGGPQRYVLYVEMQIESGRGATTKRYIADSKPNVSLAKWMFTSMNRQQAKAAAAASLLDQLIPDIEAWLQQDHAAR
jgi:hypothetical protein